MQYGTLCNLFCNEDLRAAKGANVQRRSYVVQGGTSVLQSRLVRAYVLPMGILSAH